MFSLPILILTVPLASRAPAETARPDTQVDPAVRTEVDAFLTSLRAAYQSETPELYLEHFDLRRMADEIARAAELSPLALLKSSLGFKLRASLREGFETSRAFIAWEEHRILAIERLGEGDLRVVARLIDEIGMSTKMAWWLVRHDGGWRIWDFEDLDVPLRPTLIVQALVDAGDETGMLRLAVFSLQTAAKEIANADFESARSTLQWIESDLPVPIEMSRRSLAAVAALGVEEWSEALQHADRLKEVAPDAPAHHYLRARALVRLGQPEEALAEIARYEKALAPEAGTEEVRASALTALGRTDEAKEAYRAGLRDTGASVSSLAGLTRLLGDDGGEELTAALRTAKRPAMLFDGTCDQLLTEREFDALARLISAYRAIDPDSADIDYYTACVHWSRGETEKAAPLFLRGASRTDPGQKEIFLSRYLDVMIERGEPIVGYRAVDDAEFAFSYLSDHYSEDPETLGGLVAAHRERAPDDPVGLAWHAEVTFRRGDYAKVCEILAGKLAPESDTIYWTERLLFVSYLRLKKLDEALAVAKQSTARDSDPFYEVLAQAARGDVEATMKAFEICVENHDYDPSAFYGEEDIGAILRESPIFAPLRSRWPLPVDAEPEASEEEAPDGDSDDDRDGVI